MCQMVMSVMQGGGWGPRVRVGGSVLERVVREGLPEKVIFEQKAEGVKE